MTRPRAILLVAFVALACASHAVSQAAGPRIRLNLHVALRSDGAPAVTDAWLATELAKADAAFAACDVHLVHGARTTIPAEHAWIERPAGRSALARFTTEPGEHAFFVTSLAARGDPDAMPPMGVHWQAPHARSYVIVASYADPTTLAHELGHRFGLGHARGPADLMSPTRRRDVERFTARQCTTIRSRARTLAR